VRDLKWDRARDKMKDAFVAIHGHFYQPPREDPWLEAIEPEESARPYHDWNERIASECYRPNAHARIMDGQGKILQIVNNYSYISFNFGPTLFRWLEKKFPFAYQRILEADRESLKRWGHGNAIAQVYDHIIMPLANERDRDTEVLWGVADFKWRFGREPEAMWLPETAAHYPTLQTLVKHGMKFLILSPFQALRVRPLGGAKWMDVSQGRIDPTQPYRCFMKDGSGKKLPDQFIDLFFYDGTISREVSFGDLLRDGNIFCDRLMKAYQSTKKRPQLIHIATDGETYGHHKKFGDMALAYTLHQCLSSREMEVINYGAFLERFPPAHEVELDEGPKGEGTSWSCSHGVSRWEEDCGCSTGGKAGWNQKWRKPLRGALHSLRDELSRIFEREGASVFKDPWEGREGYIQVILDRSPENIHNFFETFGLPGLPETDRVKGLRLLEAQRHALQMFTSCGWFFNDLSGIETILILQHASKAIQLAEEWVTPETEGHFLEGLAQARSNLPGMGDGRQIYNRFVKPKWMTPGKAVNHCAISSLFEDGEKGKKIFIYHLEWKQYERIEEGGRWAVLGQAKVSSEILPDTKGYSFALIPSEQDIFRAWISESHDSIVFEMLKAKCLEGLKKGEELPGILTPLFGDCFYTLQDTFQEERQSIFQKVLQKEVDEHKRIYADLFDKTRSSVEPLLKLGLEIPFEIGVAAEITLSDRLFQEVKRLTGDFKKTLEHGAIDRIVEEAKRYGYDLRKEDSCSILSEILNRKMDLLQRGMAKGSGETVESQSEKVEELMTLIDRGEQWGFNLREGEAQNIMDEILDRSLEELERDWWGWGAGGQPPFPPNLIVLAERLGFNVDRFSKIKPEGR
jgi:alpha-amylase/alpha-mannosidase (GH57 family)